MKISHRADLMAIDKVMLNYKVTKNYFLDIHEIYKFQLLVPPTNLFYSTCKTNNSLLI